MAQRAVQLDLVLERFCCSICLDLLKVPVSVSCGHNYCSECIEGYWNQDDKEGRFDCPQCRQTFIPRPVLKKNTMLAEVVDGLNKTRLQTSMATLVLPPLPAATQPAGPLPAEASQTSLPQRPFLEQIRERVVRWYVPVTDLTCAAVDSYQLYVYQHCHANNTPQQQQHWGKMGEVKALRLPMACKLTRYHKFHLSDMAVESGDVYSFHIAIRAKDIYGRFGPFSEPQMCNF